MGNEYGYNLAPLLLNLETKRYVYEEQKIDYHFQEIERCIEDQRHINTFLRALNEAQQGKAKQIDFSGPEKLTLVENVRNILRNVDPDLIPVGVNSWHVEDIPRIREALDAHIQTIETSNTLQLTHGNHRMQVLAELLKEFHELNKKDSQEKEHTIRNK